VRERAATGGRLTKREAAADSHSDNGGIGGPLMQRQVRQRRFMQRRFMQRRFMQRRFFQRAAAVDHVARLAADVVPVAHGAEIL
jgi:hypothetical protein